MPRKISPNIWDGKGLNLWGVGRGTARRMLLFSPGICPGIYNLEQILSKSFSSDHTRARKHNETRREKQDQERGLQASALQHQVPLQARWHPWKEGKGRSEFPSILGDC